MNVPRPFRGRPSSRRKPQSKSRLRRPPASAGTADGEVRPVSAPFSLESAYGSVQPSSRPEDFDAVCRVAKDAKAAKTARMG